jgi:hypothetical protein
MAKRGMAAHELDVKLMSALGPYGAETERMTNGRRFRSVVSVPPRIAQFNPPPLLDH